MLSPSPLPPCGAPLPACVDRLPAAEAGPAPPSVVPVPAFPAPHVQLSLSPAAAASGPVEEKETV